MNHKKILVLVVSWLLFNKLLADSLSADAQQQEWNNTVTYGQNYNSSSNSTAKVIQGDGNQDSINSAQANLNRYGTSQYNLSGATATTQAAVMSGDGTVNNASKQQYQTIKNADSGNQNAIINQKATGQMTKCLSESDPACAAVNKYNDDEVQNQLQGAAMGGGNYYYTQMYKADPSNQSCTKRMYYQPINPQNKDCEVGNGSKQTCKAKLSVWIENIPHPATYTDGGTVNAKNKSNGCDSGLSSYNFSMGADSAWVRLVTNKTDIQANKLQVKMSASSGKTSCAWINGYVAMGATGADIGTVWIDWHGGKKGNITLSQVAGGGCTKANNLCNIGLRLHGNNIDQTTWIQFAYPNEAYNESKEHFEYDDGCSKYR